MTEANHSRYTADPRGAVSLEEYNALVIRYNDVAFDRNETRRLAKDLLSNFRTMRMVLVGFLFLSGLEAWAIIIGIYYYV